MRLVVNATLRSLYPRDREAIDKRIILKTNLKELLCGVKRFELAGTDAHGGVPSGTSLSNYQFLKKKEKCSQVTQR
jgi:hypothetical protein